MSASEIPSSALPNYDEYETPTEWVPTPVAPEIPESIVGQDIETLIREQEEKKAPETIRPTLH